jgi:gliding motility-associated protein GldM
MAGYKETPRQKMIAMMYLVLTALLALNVSKQILDAFLVVNESMETTNENFSKKLDLTMNEFKAQYLINPNKVGPFWQKAQAAHELSQALIKYVDSVRYTVIKKADGLETMQEAKKILLREVKRKDDYDRTTRYFIGSSEDGSAGEARILKNKIEAYKKQILDLVDPSYRNTMKIGLDTKGPFYAADGVKQNWEMHNFYRTILAADVTILNKIKAEVYNAEFDVTTYLLAAISMKDFKFDQIRAKVIPKSAYVFTGEDYQAEILVAAYDSKGNPDVRYVMGSDSLYEGNFKNAIRLEGSNGIVTLKLASGSQEGLKKFAGIIKIVTPLGDTIPYHFKDEFIVAKPAITVKPSKMNVFYIGIDNPVDISVPGNPEKILPNISVGSIAPEGDHWKVYGLPKGVKEATVTVSAVFGGKTRSMGDSKFRLKTIPNPVAEIASTHNEGVVNRNVLMASPYLFAAMPPEFDFDLKYNVTGFTFSTVYNGEYVEDKVQGNRLTPEILKKITTSRKNSKIWIEGITVKGPDGDRSIPGISLRIQ